MAALTALLPNPKNSYVVHQDEAPALLFARAQPGREPPPYGKRKRFVPRSVADFGDGGAFPEIHVVQHPLNMGRPKDPTKSSTAIVAVDVDEGGEVQYDAIIKQGRKDKKIFTKHDDLKEKTGDEAALSLPSTEEAAAAADATRAALARIIGAKVEAAKPVKLAGAQGGKKEEEPTFVRYTPNPAAPGYNPQAKQRVIRLVDAQVDPMEPPKHKHKKVPRGPPSPPVPVLHSPPRKVTVADQQAWKIPPCVSNWKNARGYTIPLDKRLAADGRGLQEFSVNDQFATLSEALIIAERKARDQLALKQKLKQQLAAKEKERKEQDLRNNVVPNGHFRKDWQRQVKTWFHQPAQKKARRLARKAKAAAVAPRPVGLLRPVVHCSTQKYSSKIRAGRGFSLDELKEAGISKKLARTIGIAVDHRRTNKSVEAMQANVARLNEYKAKLIVFPRKSNQKPKKGDSSPAETSAATQVSLATAVPMPVASDEVEFADVTDEMKGFAAHSTLRIAKNEAKLYGIRIRMAKEKEEAK